MDKGGRGGGASAEPVMLPVVWEARRGGGCCCGFPDDGDGTGKTAHARGYQCLVHCLDDPARLFEQRDTPLSGQRSQSLSLTVGPAATSSGQFWHGSCVNFIGWIPEPGWLLRSYFTASGH